jgi:hypothetical protein
MSDEMRGRGVKSFAVRSPLDNMHGHAALGSAIGRGVISYLASHMPARASCHVSLSVHASAIVRKDLPRVVTNLSRLLEVPAAALEHVAADALAAYILSVSSVEHDWKQRNGVGRFGLCDCRSVDYTARLPEVAPVLYEADTVAADGCGCCGASFVKKKQPNTMYSRRTGGIAQSGAKCYFSWTCYS